VGRRESEDLARQSPDQLEAAFAGQFVGVANRLPAEEPGPAGHRCSDRIALGLPAGEEQPQHEASVAGGERTEDIVYGFGVGAVHGRDNNASMGRLVKTFGRIVGAESLHATLDAAEIRAVAEREAEAILARAHAESARLCEEATRAGKDAGRALAEAEFRALLSSAVTESERIRRAAIPSARQLAVRMAEKIVGRAVQLEPQILNDIAERALLAAGARTGTIVVRVHPDELAQLSSDPERLAAHLESGAELRIVGDPTVDRSGCIVDTQTGRLDARLRSQLAVLELAAFGAPAQSSRE
jgi:type III secretion protein L